MQEETMKKTFLTFALAVMLTASLTACTTRPADTNNATGNGNGSVTEDSTANSRARTGTNNGSTMRRDGQYYADDKGDVSGSNDGIGNDIRRAADDVMDGVGNAVNDMTH